MLCHTSKDVHCHLQRSSIDCLGSAQCISTVSQLNTSAVCLRLCLWLSRTGIPSCNAGGPSWLFSSGQDFGSPRPHAQSEIRRAWRIPISPGQRGDHAAGQPCWHWALTYSSTAFIYRQINSKDQTQHYSFAISYINTSTHIWSINVSLSCVCQKLCHIWRALRF